jgi:O-antigen ligase
MRRVFWHSLRGLSVVGAAACALWLVLLSMFLLSTGGTYSRTFEDGSVACGIPVFTREEWFWPAHQLFGAPLALLVAFWRTAAYSSGRVGMLE